ncbi:MAG: hypothetical protein V4625_04560 [Pseudomonadota bacterium]
MTQDYFEPRRARPRGTATGRAAVAVIVTVAGVCMAQTPGLPAAAEPTAPASRIGPPVTTSPPLTATPSRTTPLGSATMTLPKTPTDPSRTTVPPMTPASAPRA